MPLSDKLMMCIIIEPKLIGHEKNGMGNIAPSHRLYLILTRTVGYLANTYSIFRKSLAPTSVLAQFVLPIQGIE